MPHNPLIILNRTHFRIRLRTMAKKYDLTTDQKRLLYLISHYSTASDRGEEEMWIQEMALLALISKAINEGAFKDYDLAPNLISFHGTKRYANISQEAKNDLKHLRESFLVNKVKISTKYYDHISAFSITLEGLRALKDVSKSDKAAIDGIIRCRKCKTELDLQMKDKVTQACKKCGLEEEVMFFELEDIPYKSRPYFPKEGL